MRQATIFLVFAFSLLSFFPAPISAGVFQTMGEPNDDDMAVAIVNQTANGYRIIANRHDYDPVSRTIRVLQMDRSGAVIATDSYSSTYDPAARYATNTADGGFVIIGSYPQLQNGGYILKSDSNGEPVWGRKIETSGYLHGLRIMQMNDGGFVASYMLTTGSVEGILVTRLDATGNTVWSLSISDGVLDYQAWMLTPATDDGLVIAGVLLSGPGNEYDQLALFKITAAGAIDWYRHVSFPGEHFAQGAVIQASNDGYLVSGGMNSLPMKGSLVKFTDSGQLDWAHYIESTGDPVTFTDVQVTFDGGYIMTGWSFNEAENATDVIIAKMSASGEPLWAREAGVADRSAWEYGFQIEESLTGGYLVAGLINNPFGDPFESDIVLLATDPRGYISGCDRITALTLTETDVTSSISVTQRTIAQDSPVIINTDITSSIMTNPSYIPTFVHCQSVSDVPALGIFGIAVLLITMGLVIRVMSR